MKSLRLWHISAAFFAICAALNLYGCIIESGLADTVKPALMPLLCLTTMAALAQGVGIKSREAKLLACAQLFGFGGDTALIGSDAFALFAIGIGLFLVGHIFYITLFGGKSWKGLKLWAWVVAVVVALTAVACLVKAIGISGALMAPMAVYGLMLMTLIFSTLTGALRFKTLTWWLLTAGAVMFTFSDSLIAIRTFGHLSPLMSGFGVMGTYLLAQTLLAIGSYRLISQK